MPIATGERRAKGDALQGVQAFLASGHATTQEKVNRLVGFLANDLNNTGGEEPTDGGDDILAKEAEKKKAEQEALLKALTGGGASALAADNTETQGMQHSNLVMLYSGDSNDLVADGLANKQAEQEALLKKLTGGRASALAAVNTEGQGEPLSQATMLSDAESSGLAADRLTNKQSEQEALLKKLTGEVNMATDDQDELVEQIIEDLANAPNDDTPGEESLLGSETKVQTNGQLNSESDPAELVDQVIDALANTNDGTEESGLLTSEFNGEVNGGVSLKARDTTADETVDQVIDALANTNDGTEGGALLTSEFNGEVNGGVSLEVHYTTTDDMVDQVTQYLANAKEPTSDEEALLASAHSGDPEVLAQLLAKESATADEKVDQLVAYFAPTNSIGKEPKPDKASHKEASIDEHSTQKEKHENPRGNNTTALAVALALEATTASTVAQQLRAPDTTNVSLEQDHLPHVMFGGAFLLLAAVVLTVMTKRSRIARPTVNQDEAYAYLLHE